MKILFSCRPAYGHEVVFGTGETFVDRTPLLSLGWLNPVLPGTIVGYCLLHA